MRRHVLQMLGACLVFVCLWGAGCTPKSEEQGSGLFVVCQGGKYGFIDRTGAIVITPQFDGALPFSEGLALVGFEGSEPCFIDRNGKVAITLHDGVDGVLPFSCGLAAISVGGKWGFVDKSGEVVIAPQFAEASMFHEGLAAVTLDGRLGYIDTSGRAVVSPTFQSWRGAVGAFDFSEGLAAVAVDDKFGFIDKSGKIVIAPRFDGAWCFFDGLAAVVVGGKIGFIDKSGKMVIAQQFDGTSGFSEGLAGVLVGDNWGYIDKTGRIVIAPTYGQPFSAASGDRPIEVDWSAPGLGINRGCAFSEGLAAILVNGEFGYIDRSGKMVIVPQFDRASRFSGGLAEVQVVDARGYARGYIDKQGRYIWAPSR